VTRAGALALLLLTACGGADDDGASTTAVLPPDTLVLADGVQLDGVSLYQGTEVALMRAGEAVDPASQVPLIAGRDALARVFVSFDESYDRGAVTARLTIGGEIFESRDTVRSKSSPFSLSSSFNFDVDGELFDDAASWQVELLQPQAQSSGDNAAATSHAQTLSVHPGSSLKIMLLPVLYGADGSDRAPDTSEHQLTRYREAFLATYPIADIDITVADAMTTQTWLDPDGSGWDELLEEIFALRTERGVADDVFLYGLVMPAANHASYCTTGCTLGNSYFNESGASDLRAGVGLGFTGDEATWIALHELGHQLGRGHAPCAVPDPDLSYPHADGKIGRWGYDRFARSLKSPKVNVDFMSYCAPTWVSDYTYGALLKRIERGAPGENSGDATSAKSYQTVRVSGAGHMTRGAKVTLPAMPASTLSTRSGSLDGRSLKLTGHFVRYSHVPGGVLLLP
jgi:hypothetical protein